MAFNRFEQSLIDQYTNTQFPDLPPEPEQPMQPPGTQPGDVLVAEAGSRGLPESAYTGQTQAEMKPFDPTIKQRIADFLQAGLEGVGVDRYTARKNAQSLIGGPSSNLPLEMGIADLLAGVNKAALAAMTPIYVQEGARAIESGMESAKRGQYGQAAFETGVGLLDVVPGVVGGVNVGRKLVEGAKAIAPMIPKDVPVGASTDVVGGGTQAMLQAGKASAPVSDIGFYSAVEDAALNLQRKSGSGQAMLNDITKAANVKADEIKWIGLDDFLKGKKNVTREEVQQFIANNKVDVQEVTLGGAEPFDAQRLSQLESEYKALKQHPIDDPSFGEEKYDEMIRLMNIRDQSTTQSLYDAADQATRSAQRAQQQGNRITAEKYFREAELLNTRAEKLDLQGQGMSKPPKFGRYTLPGGENYREILLTMPNKEPAMPKGYEVTSVQYDDGTSRYFAETPTTRSAAYKTEEDAKAELQRMVTGLKGFRENLDSFKSSHWNEKNVLAHIRVNDRVDADGKKMLLVEEVQSDWHQAGRDKGYATADINTRLKESEKELEQIGLQIRGLSNRMASLSDAQIDEFNKLADERQKLYDRQGFLMDEGNALIDKRNAGVPDAPMKDTWYQLALKRVLKYAADNGYERVGLTTGARQAERFDLSKQVDELLYKRNEDGTYRLSAQTGSRGNLLGEAIPESKLSDYVGKEVAKSIIEGSGKDVNLGGAGTVSQPKDMWKSMSGLDLQVGGEGMKTYYDQIYPQFLAKYGKKWGAKAGETSVSIDNGFVEPIPSGGWKQTQPTQEPIRYIDITPEMRKSVGKGQPLFTAIPAGTAATGVTMQDKEQK